MEMILLIQYQYQRSNFESLEKRRIIWNQNVVFSQNNVFVLSNLMWITLLTLEKALQCKSGSANIYPVIQTHLTVNKKHA